MEHKHSSHRRTLQTLGDVYAQTRKSVWWWNPKCQTHKVTEGRSGGDLPSRLPFSCATFFTCSWNARSSSSDLFGRLRKHDIASYVFL